MQANASKQYFDQTPTDGHLEIYNVVRTYVLNFRLPLFVNMFNEVIWMNDMLDLFVNEFMNFN